MYIRMLRKPYWTFTVTDIDVLYLLNQNIKFTNTETRGVDFHITKIRFNDYKRLSLLIVEWSINLWPWSNKFTPSYDLRVGGEGPASGVNQYIFVWTLIYITQILGSIFKYRQPINIYLFINSIFFVVTIRGLVP